MKTSIHSLVISVLFIFVTAYLTGCNSGDTGSASIKETLPAYSIVSDDEFGVGNTRREVNVRLEMAATEDELVAIANEIKNKTRKSYERTNILFWLPEMEVGTGAWARVTFNPDFERVHIMGD